MRRSVVAVAVVLGVLAALQLTLAAPVSFSPVPSTPNGPLMGVFPDTKCGEPTKTFVVDDKCHNIKNESGGKTYASYALKDGYTFGFLMDSGADDASNDIPCERGSLEWMIPLGIQVGVCQKVFTPHVWTIDGYAVESSRVIDNGKGELATVVFYAGMCDHPVFEHTISTQPAFPKDCIDASNMTYDSKPFKAFALMSGYSMTMYSNADCVPGGAMFFHFINTLCYHTEDNLNLDGFKNAHNLALLS